MSVEGNIEFLWYWIILLKQIIVISKLVQYPACKIIAHSTSHKETSVLKQLLTSDYPLDSTGSMACAIEM